MVSAVTFQTHARTIDHLGREQIADCPTAISELWKNAYDAYARNVYLHVLDGDFPVAAVLDDGHGMSKDELVGKWLVIGTNSKIQKVALTKEEREARAKEEEQAVKDRGGLPERPKQGKKGIGRLSSAALGSVLLLVSKRENGLFVAAYVDWRLFENPFMMLHDITVPVEEFEYSHELPDVIDRLHEVLLTNFSGDDNDRARTARIKNAWDSFDLLETTSMLQEQMERLKKEHLNENLLSSLSEKADQVAEYIETGNLIELQNEVKALLANALNGHDFDFDNDLKTTRQKITEVSGQSRFSERHFTKWDAYWGKKDQGTALFISDIVDDMQAQLTRESWRNNTNSPEATAQINLVETLTNFSDPYSVNKSHFQTEVHVWLGDYKRAVIFPARTIDHELLEHAEHCIDGHIDEDGVFNGRVRAFGSWLDGTVKIAPPYEVPWRKNVKVGSFDLKLLSFEPEPKNSSLTADILKDLNDHAEQYAGVLVFRDHLRVMPYGRTDNDFFKIEERRGKHAGREFWRNRGMFGRIAISTQANPNLRDKAGREGIIDNKASKVFKDIIVNILMTSARRYFGIASEFRKDILPKIQADYKVKKAEEDRKKLLKSQKKIFTSKLKKLDPLLFSFQEEVDEFISDLVDVESIDLARAIDLQVKVENLQDASKAFSLTPVPSNLGKLEEQYRDYRDRQKYVLERLMDAIESIRLTIRRLSPEPPEKQIEKEIQRNAARIHSRIRQLVAQAESVLNEESARLKELSSEQYKAYHAAVAHLTEDVGFQRISLQDASEQLDLEREKQLLASERVFLPYIRALESMRDDIDLANLANESVIKSDAAEKDLSRIQNLSQLGITVEVMGHELERLEATITEGLALMPEETKSTELFKSIQTAHNELHLRLKVLSPLKLSGEVIKERITGEKIFNYLQSFFHKYLEDSRIQLSASKEFLRFYIYEQEALVYPVFVNLINNARYWVCQWSKGQRKILLTVVNHKVVVADDGPGVDEDDVSELFTIFFTRKAKGGRGVGLYLCKANLAQGRHSISYETDEKNKVLPGANFVLDFQGAKYD